MEKKKTLSEFKEALLENCGNNALEQFNEICTDVATVEAQKELDKRERDVFLDQLSFYTGLSFTRYDEDYIKLDNDVLVSIDDIIVWAFTNGLIFSRIQEEFFAQLADAIKTQLSDMPSLDDDKTVKA